LTAWEELEEHQIDIERLRAARVISGHRVDTEAHTKQPRTLSVYGKKTTEYDMINRPLTSFAYNDRIKFMANNQLREIDEIKKRLNRNKVRINCLMEDQCSS